MLARIYQPSKTAMQSGKANQDEWRLEFESETARRIDPLMGWTGASDMKAGEVRLTFDSKEAAVAYAEKHRIPCQVVERSPKRPAPKAYSDNFASRRRAPWTH